MTSGNRSDPLESRTEGPVTYLHCPRWTERGILHGFIGASLDFRGDKLHSSVRAFLSVFGFRRLILLRQVHGAGIAVCDGQSDPAFTAEWTGAEGRLFRTKEGADAFLLPQGPASGDAYGVLTADCAPILLCAPDGGTALVHAGWRGIAAGLPQKTADLLGGRALEAAIGPCAGAERYEVGDEVIEQLGTSAVHSPSRQGKRFLSVARTAARSLEAACAAQFISTRCTIEDAAFHSFRRDGERMGLNLAFLGA